MFRFNVGRGHDGPARSGTVKTDVGEVSTPIIIGPSSSGFRLHYFTLGRDAPVSERMSLCVMPSMFFYETTGTADVHAEMCLLPAIPSSDALGDRAADIVLTWQLSLLSDRLGQISPASAILRIPPMARPEVVRTRIADAARLGVRAAAFMFDGTLGPRDTHNLRLRSLLPHDWLTLALGRVEPAFIPLLYYLGFDLIDGTYAESAAIRRLRLWRMDSESIQSENEPRFCSCIACAGKRLNGLDVNDLLPILIKHNESVYDSILSEATTACANGVLRWLVESMTHHSPAMAALLRRIDRTMYGYLEEFTPTTYNNTLLLIGPESYNSPVVRRFRERVAARYTPSPGKRLVVLLPCSAKKPYSESKSHQAFRSVIDSALGDARAYMSEVILTSPLGVVPRELERISPASKYDIPVTGDWDAEETSLAAEALVTHLSKFPEDVVVIAHVSEGYADIVRRAEDRIKQSIVYTTEGHRAVSRESLVALEQTLRDMRGLLSIGHGPHVEAEETLRATADFQFGPGAGRALIPPGSRLRGRLHQTVICHYNGGQTCSFNGATGTLSLTLAGGQLLAPLQRYIVHFDGDTLTGGSLFAVGVTDADPMIRPGDEVIVVNRADEVVAVGRSEMSGSEMCQLRHGRAVSLRHKVG